MATSADDGTTSLRGHAAYLLDRDRKIGTMLSEIAASSALQKKFFKNPNSVAKTYKVVLNPDEAMSLSALEGKSNWPIVAQRMLMMRPVSFFDNNCGCGGGGSGPRSW